MRQSSILLVLLCASPGLGLQPSAEKKNVFLQLEDELVAADDDSAHSNGGLLQFLEEEAADSHPLWVFDASPFASSRTYVCALFLLLAGVLCSAGGIGGGGIYVTVLMVAGQLSVRDSVPLSKSIVFLGSMSSLYLNLKKTRTAQGGEETIIDYNVCRLVVPSALVGTYMGVFLNSVMPSSMILVALTGILIGISWMVTQTTLQQHAEEQRDVAGDAESAGNPQEQGPGRNEGCLTGWVQVCGLRGRKQEQGPRGKLGTILEVPLPEEKADLCSEAALRNCLSRTEVVIAAAMLVVVVAGSVFRHHAINCEAAATRQEREHSCEHPLLFWLGRGILEHWMATPSTAGFIKVFCLAGPLLVCCSVLAYNTSLLVCQAGWRLGTACQFNVMAVITGCLAGLVGIGGGLVFAPFFLLMGLEPAVAVATSSTCVIFTSSSTTFQFLLTDRVIVSLALLYGSVNLAASYVGTTLVHELQDKFAARRSYISAIVAVGVVISTILSTVKLVSLLGDPAAGVVMAH